MAEEIFHQIGRKSTVFRLIGIFTFTAFLGTFSARSWARSHFNTVAYLLEIQHGYEGISVGYSGFGSLLISLVERRGAFFVKKLEITRDHEILQREFTPRNRYIYPDLWPAGLNMARTVDDLHVRVRLIMNSWVLALVLIVSMGVAGVWLIITSWLELLGREKLEIALAEKMAAQARQVAHDIRSPMAALEIASADAEKLPMEARLLINSAIGRINEIADSLLDRQRALTPAPQTEASLHRLSSLIESLTAEKRLQFRSLTGVEIKDRLDDSSRGVLAQVQPVEFKRLLSNLINNAVEAFDERGGTVTVSLISRNGRASVSVQDDGKGIPLEILSKLGRRGETHGKAGGTGLGLFHARTSAESWGGSLKIASEIGKGTTMTVEFPEASSSGEPTDGWDAVLIDDDPLTRMTWKMAASRAGKRFSAFATLPEFLKASPSFSRLTPIYIDAELCEGVSGAKESVRIHELGFEKIVLTTGHPASAFSGFTHLSGVIGKEPPWDDVAP